MVFSQIRERRNRRSALKKKAITNPRPNRDRDHYQQEHFRPGTGSGSDPGSRGDLPGLSTNTQHGSLGTPRYLGRIRSAILEDGGVSSGVPGTPGQSIAPIRIKLGDTVEGFRLSEISEKSNCSCQGAATVISGRRRSLCSQNPYSSAVRITSGPSKSGGTSGHARVAAPRVATPGQPNVPARTAPRAIPLYRGESASRRGRVRAISRRNHNPRAASASFTASHLCKDCGSPSGVRCLRV